MYMKKTALFLMILILAGCAAPDAKEENAPETEESAVVSTGRISGVKVGENRDFFIGADITEDINVENIDAFEEKFPVHDLYAEEVSVDEGEKAADFILECYSRGKTPYIIIKNKDGIGEEDFKKYAMEMAGALGRYHVRVMAEVLENSYYYDEGGEKYEYLAQLIKEENDLAETIWSVKSDDIILVGSLLPEENTDYICVNGYFSSLDGAERMFSEIRDHLNTDKEVIFRFGAASYSGEDCVYTPEEAEKTVEFVYDSVKKDEGAAGVIYMDKNRKLSDRVIFTDYSVTADKELSEGYIEIINEALAYRDGGTAENGTERTEAMGDEMTGDKKGNKNKEEKEGPNDDKR